MVSMFIVVVNIYIVRPRHYYQQERSYIQFTTLIFIRESRWSIHPHHLKIETKSESGVRV